MVNPKSSLILIKNNLKWMQCMYKPNLALYKKQATHEMIFRKISFDIHYWTNYNHNIIKSRSKKPEKTSVVYQIMFLKLSTV